MNNIYNNMFQEKKDKELVRRGAVKQAICDAMEENQIMPGSPDYGYLLGIIDSVPKAEEE